MILSMKRRYLAFSLGVFAIFAVLAGLYVQLLHQTAGFSISDHSFRLRPGTTVLLAAGLWIVLLSLWAGYAKLVGRLCGVAERDVLTQDFLTYLPLLFISLAPLTLDHYIGAGDLASRLKLLGLGIGTAVLCLKIVQLGRWGKTPAFWSGWERRFRALSPRRKSVLIFLTSLVLFNAASWLMIASGAAFGGDEPHYLLITHSLLRDGDFDLADNYARRDYARYMMFEGRIAPHVVGGARPGTQHSFHSPGVAFLMLPFYAFGSLFEGRLLLFFIRLGMSLWGALFSLQVYLYGRQEWSEKLGLLLWSLTSFTAPVLFYSIHIYPEVVVASLALAVFRMLRFSPTITPLRAGLCGALIVLPIWFHALKYVFLTAPLFLFGFLALRRRPGSRFVPWVFCLASFAVGLLYLLFQKSLYGTYSLSAVSWARDMTDTGEKLLDFVKTLLFRIPFRDRWETLAGYALDQRDGLLLYAPVYFFSLLGAVEMLRRKKGDFLVLFLVTAPYVLVSAFLTQRTGYAPQARPLVAVIWAAIIGLGHFLSANKKNIPAAAFRLAAGLSYLFAVLLLKYPLNLYQETTRGTQERAGGLFDLLSNIRFRLSNVLPSFLKTQDRHWLPNIVWLAAIAVFIASYGWLKKRRFSATVAGHVLATCAALSVFFIWFALYPRFVLRNPVHTGFPGGKKVTFYSLSRSAKMTEAGRFLLSEDGRPFRFFLTTPAPVKEMKITLGSTESEHGWRLWLFDELVAEGTTRKDFQTVTLPSPPRYPLGKSSYYTLILDLGQGTGPPVRTHPYIFRIQLEF